jgi:ElaB/YqjD/DUF883 family membrane-anchored ribosome-binding protein
METPTVNKMKDQVTELKDAYKEERQSALHLAQTAVDTSKEAVALADNWVRYNAWKLIGVTLALGFMAGLLFKRRSAAPTIERVPR